MELRQRSKVEEADRRKVGGDNLHQLTQLLFVARLRSEGGEKGRTWPGLEKRSAARTGTQTISMLR